MYVSKPRPRLQMPRPRLNAQQHK